MFPNAPEYVYPSIVGGAITVAFLAILHAGRVAGIPVRRLIMLEVAIGMFAQVGGRLYLLLELGVRWQWTDLLKPGYRYPGALAGALLALVSLGKVLLPGVPLGLLADCVAPAIAFYAAVMRVGCFVIGCCVGTPSNLPWAVQFPPESRASRIHARLGLISSSALPSVHVHPLQLYFLGLSVGVGSLLMLMRRRKLYNGELLIAFLALHELGKAALELFREDPLTPGTHGLVPLVSLALGTVAAATLVAIRTWRSALPRRPVTASSLLSEW